MRYDPSINNQVRVLRASLQETWAEYNDNHKAPLPARMGAWQDSGTAMENNNERGRGKEFHQKLTGWLKSVVCSPPAVIAILHEKP